MYSYIKSQAKEVKQITTQASLKVKADGKGVYFGPIDVAVSGYSDETITVIGKW